MVNAVEKKTQQWGIGEMNSLGGVFDLERVVRLGFSHRRPLSRDQREVRV